MTTWIGTNTDQIRILRQLLSLWIKMALPLDSTLSTLNLTKMVQVAFSIKIQTAIRWNRTWSNSNSLLVMSLHPHLLLHQLAAPTQSTFHGLQATTHKLLAIKLWCPLITAYFTMLAHNLTITRTLSQSNMTTIIMFLSREFLIALSWLFCHPLAVGLKRHPKLWASHFNHLLTHQLTYSWQKFNPVNTV